MNNLQQYIDLLKSEKDKAKKDIETFENNPFVVHYNEGAAWALSFAITKAELLLKNSNESNTA